MISLFMFDTTVNRKGLHTKDEDRQWNDISFVLFHKCSFITPSNKMCYAKMYSKFWHILPDISSLTLAV